MATTSTVSGRYKKIFTAYQKLMAEIKEAQKIEKQLARDVSKAVDKQKIGVVMKRIKNIKK